MVIQSCCAISRLRRKPTVIVNRATKPSIVNYIQRLKSIQPQERKQPEAIIKQQLNKTIVKPIVVVVEEDSLLLEPQLLQKNSRIEEIPVEDFRFVDISDQNLGTLPEFINENSNQIEHLILDGNELNEYALEEIPRLEKLTSLSLNSNKIKNIGLLLQFLARKCPNLRFLSLIGNPGWPHPIINPNFQLYHKYALAAAKFLPTLRFLDTLSVAAFCGKKAGARLQHCNLL